MSSFGKSQHLTQNQLFLPMRGYEIRRERCNSLSLELFLPMRGYELFNTIHNVAGVAVISPHEGL